MKKILVIMLASLALFNSSCKKDNGEEIAPLANGKPIGTEEISLYPPPGHYDQIAATLLQQPGAQTAIDLTLVLTGQWEFVLLQADRCW